MKSLMYFESSSLFKTRSTNQTFIWALTTVYSGGINQQNGVNKLTILPFEGYGNYVNKVRIEIFYHVIVEIDAHILVSWVDF